jgi:hypothetical protein
MLHFNEWPSFWVMWFGVAAIGATYIWWAIPARTYLQALAITLSSLVLLRLLYKAAVDIIQPTHIHTAPVVILIAEVTALYAALLFVLLSITSRLLDKNKRLSD